MSNALWMIFSLGLLFLSLFVMISYVFKINLKKADSWLRWLENEQIRNVEYIGFYDSSVFTKSNITWKELIKENEKRSS